MRTNKEMLSHIDHTLLKADATWEEIKSLCEEAVEYKTAGVCIPSAWVHMARKEFPDLNICTVIGFPLGNVDTAAKREEAARAVMNGADEIDMVMNIGYFKSGFIGDVIHEIDTIKHDIGDKILKVIVETCYLTEEEKVKVCECLNETDVDYIKTSTGFGSGGARIDDIELFKEHLDPRIKIKASGGIKTKDKIEMFLNAGADRIGASSAIEALKEN